MRGNKEAERAELECEKFWVFVTMIAVGGYLGAYTFILKGRVFCNAQTANFVLMSVNIGTFNFKKALYYLIPISAYFAGAVISELMPKYTNSTLKMRWDTFFIGFEMLAFSGIAFIPDDAPPQICQVVINFVASMQYNTFRQSRHVAMATTFCTNHLRQTGVKFVKWLRHKNKDILAELLMHLSMIAAFTAGGGVSALLCTVLKGRALLGAEIPLLVVFIALLSADLGEEKDKLNIVPRGH